MIEYKAECGHTVRARNEDAGKVVRCSYCGRETEVPADTGDDLEFLFNEVEKTSAQSPGPKKAPRRGRAGPFMLGKRSRGAFDPFGIVLKMGYAAILIVVVYAVSTKWIFPLWDKDSRRVAQDVRRGDDGRVVRKQRQPAAPKQARRNREYGLITLRGNGGLYGMSVPTGAVLYCALSEEVGVDERVRNVRNCMRIQTDGEVPNVPPGVYTIEVALPWHEPKIKSYPGYREFRRKVEFAKDKERRRAVREFFLPDGASDVLVKRERDDITYIYRRYENIEIHKGEWTTVRALFLPRIRGETEDSFLIEPVVTKFLPKESLYSFDENNVRSELDIYDVPLIDRQYIVDALSRIGAIPYRTPDGRLRLFKVRVDNGLFAPRVIEEPSQ
ncbi:MAG: hypothetical protein IID36_12925 [Planctomycetes bacterium]|nr:hypothetical protein [Planctomycetota bacterium]